MSHKLRVIMKDKITAYTCVACKKIVTISIESPAGCGESDELLTIETCGNCFYHGKEKGEGMAAYCLIGCHYFTAGCLEADRDCTWKPIEKGNIIKHLYWLALTIWFPVKSKIKVNILRPIKKIKRKFTR